MNNEVFKHIEDLRKSLIKAIVAMIVGTAICYFFHEPIYRFLVDPLAQAMQKTQGQRLIYTGLTEAFFTTIKLSFFAGIFITFPYLLIQIWMFVAPGLYKNEKKAFFPFLVATPILFYLGGLCVYYIIMPLAWPFFLGFQTAAPETGLPIQLEARISEYLDLIITLIFAFGFCFQLPVLLTLLGRAGLVKAHTLIKFRKYAVIVTFVIAAFITPPDIISQILLAIPLLGLYEISILLIKRYDNRTA